MAIKKLLFVILFLLPPSVFADTPSVHITIDTNYRYIKSNGIPDHSYGRFPNRSNPNAVSSQNHNYRVPLRPKISGQMTNAMGQPFGVAINGVPFDPGTAEVWQGDSNWRYEALSGFIDLGLDKNNAHVQPTGAYHYHGIPKGLVKNSFPVKHSELVGYAADGFPIYARYGYSEPNDPESQIKPLKSSYRLKSGRRPGGPGGKFDGTFVQDYEYVEGVGDLDECNGRVGRVPDYEHETYHYFLTDDYPFIPRCYKGEPDSSFSRRMGSEGGMHSSGRHERERGRHPDLNRAAQKLGVSTDRLRRALGPPPPDHEAAANKLGISVRELKEALHG